MTDIHSKDTLCTRSGPATLATAKHGRCVQLGDGLLPCPFCGSPAERIDFGPGSGDNEGGSCVACTVCQHSGPIEFGYKENFISNWNRRALSAQPSPGGQGDALHEAVGRIFGCDGSPWRTREVAAVLRDYAALAARQPVGESVAWMTHHDEPMLFPTAAEAAAYCDDDEPPIPLYAAPPAQPVDLVPAAIPDTPEVRDILGRPNFWCSPWANILRKRGDVIPCKAEEEQAAVILFMLNQYLAHGAGWAEAAEAELQAIRYQVARND